jgi:GTPase SAR1 family protein
MGHWLEELQENLPEDTVLHLVGTKADIVAEDPAKRAVAFETCVAYAAEHLYPVGQNNPAPVATIAAAAARNGSGARTPADPANVGSPQSNRSSMGFWGLDLGWDSCHEVSASTGEGVEEVFRVITRRLVEQRAARAVIEEAEEEEERERRAEERMRRGGAHRPRDWANGGPYGAGGSFRVGIGDKRRSWLGLPQFPGTSDSQGGAARRRGPCCGG